MFPRHHPIDDATPFDAIDPFYAVTTFDAIAFLMSSLPPLCFWLMDMGKFLLWLYFSFQFSIVDHLDGSWGLVGGTIGKMSQFLVIFHINMSFENILAKH